ncbi:hypothetical protein BST61_g3713 [Cercospora zeina]
MAVEHCPKQSLCISCCNTDPAEPPLPQDYSLYHLAVLRALHLRRVFQSANVFIGMQKSHQDRIHDLLQPYVDRLSTEQLKAPWDGIRTYTRERTRSGGLEDATLSCYNGSNDAVFLSMTDNAAFGPQEYGPPSGTLSLAQTPYVSNPSAPIAQAQGSLRLCRGTVL